MKHDADKITQAEFYPEREGLTWIKTKDKDMFPDGDLSADYECWLLVEHSTGRMLASVEAPYPDKLCYVVAIEGGNQRRYIAPDGAKSYALGRALEILRQERCDRSHVRKARRMERLSK